MGEVHEVYIRIMPITWIVFSLSSLDFGGNRERRIRWPHRPRHDNKQQMEIVWRGAGDGRRLCGESPQNRPVSRCLNRAYPKSRCRGRRLVTRRIDGPLRDRPLRR